MDIYQTVERFYTSVNAPKCVIGSSYLGKKIFAVKVGKGAPVGIAQYALHGREFITAKLALEHFKRGVYKGSLWIVPLANPDGALMSERGVDWIRSEKTRKKLYALNGGKSDFSLWKANARGVDLNVNFDARWGQGWKNLQKAGAENYIGTKPFSERETRALKRFTQRVLPDYTVSYHTKGEEIYWYFHQPEGAIIRDFRLGKVLSGATGYALKKTVGSVGGYKDWCIEKYKIPAFTIEAGRDVFSHPLRDKEFEDILSRNEDALYKLSKEF